MVIRIQIYEFVEFYKKAQPTKYHNFFAEYFRATNGTKKEFDNLFMQYLETRYKNGEFKPSMQSWHKYLKIRAKTKLPLLT